MGHFGTRDDPIIMMRKSFEEMGLYRLWRPLRLQRLMRSMRLQKFLKAQKSLLKTSESSRFMNSANFDVNLMFWKKKVFLYNHEISGWILATFLLEAFEASLCYFFENWLMKHKNHNLLKPLGTVIYWNFQFYYPSEPFSFHHFIVRHPVGVLIQDQIITNSTFKLKSTCNCNALKVAPYRLS